MSKFSKLVKHLKHRATRAKTYAASVLAVMIPYQTQMSTTAYADEFTYLMLALALFVAISGGDKKNVTNNAD